MAGPCREAGPGYALDVEDSFVMNVEFHTGVDERLDLPWYCRRASTAST